MKALCRALALVSFATTAQAVPLSVIDGDHNILGYEGGIDAFGHTSTLYADSAGALGGWADALAAGHTIIVEERAKDYAPVADAAAFIAGGGRMIVMGGCYASDIGFVNALLGTSLSSACDTGGTFYRTATATPTTFADVPVTLAGLNSIHDTTGALPDDTQVFYEEVNGNAMIFRAAIGDGDLFYFGFDYCCDGTSTQRLSWLTALDSAIRFDARSLNPVPLPAGLPLLLAGLTVFGLMRRRT